MSTLARERSSRTWPPTPWEDDEALAVRVARGDGEAFARIYERYHRPLYRYCVALLGNQEDARDAIQTVMLNAFRTLSERPREITVRPWLYRIAHNVSVSLIRSRYAFAELPVDVAGPGLSCERVVQRERLAHLIGDLYELPDRGRGALVMRELQGLEYHEIGDALCISAAAARQAVFEARLALGESERARELDCDAVSEQIASGDGRRLRARAMRIHLAACASCRELTASIRSAKRRACALSGVVLGAPAWVLKLITGEGGGLAVAGKGLAVGAATLALGIGFGSLPGSGPPPPRPETHLAAKDPPIATETARGQSTDASGADGIPWGGDPGAASNGVPARTSGPGEAHEDAAAGQGRQSGVGSRPQHSAAPDPGEEGSLAGRSSPAHAVQSSGEVTEEVAATTGEDAGANGKDKGKATGKDKDKKDPPGRAAGGPPGQAVSAGNPGHGGTPPGQTAHGGPESPHADTTAPGGQGSKPSGPPGQDGVPPPGQGGDPAGQGSTSPGQLSAPPGQWAHQPDADGQPHDNGGGGNGIGRAYGHAPNPS